MSNQKKTSLNLRISETEKKELENLAKSRDLKISEYVRGVLFGGVANETQSDTIDIQPLLEQLNAKDEQILTLHRLLENQQTLLLNVQKENQLLLEHEDSKKSWWQFWK